MHMGFTGGISILPLFVLLSIIPRLHLSRLGLQAPNEWAYALSAVDHCGMVHLVLCLRHELEGFTFGQDMFNTTRNVIYI